MDDWIVPRFDLATLRGHLAQCNENIDKYEAIILREEERRLELQRLIALAENYQEQENDDEFE